MKGAAGGVVCGAVVDVGVGVGINGGLGVAGSFDVTFSGIMVGLGVTRGAPPPPADEGVGVGVGVGRVSKSSTVFVIPPTVTTNSPAGIGLVPYVYSKFPVASAFKNASASTFMCTMLESDLPDIFAL